MDEIQKYYNKFNEDKRLKTRHGIVEFTVSMEYIKKYLKPNAKIIDIGAGTGRYSGELNSLGFDITAVEYVNKNLSVLKQNYPQIKALQGDARNLPKFKDNSFDLTILFGPMYHLFTKDDKLKALLEAKRITKKGGYIFVAYVLTDYALIRYGFMDNNINQSIKDNKIDSRFNIISKPEDLYSYVRLDDINELNEVSGLKREKIIAPDGATDYIRSYINKLSEEDFQTYIKYQLSNCERPELLGASSHLVDILVKE